MNTHFMQGSRATDFSGGGKFKSS